MGNSLQHIFLIRHLKTQSNEDRVIMGRVVDSPILLDTVSQFKSNLKTLKNKFSGLNDAVFYTSPALRCKQTVEIAISELSHEAKDYIVDKRLHETDLGTFSGLDARKIREKYPHLIDVWLNHPERITFPEGESYAAVQRRAWEWLESILMTSHKSIIAVTHVDIIKMILFKNLEIPIAKKRLLAIDPGSITILSKRSNEIVLIGANLS